MATDPPRADADPSSALPRGTRLGEFELLHVLGAGGFGIVYLAFDHALEREVAVKEYMPASLAGRTETLHVSLRSQSDADTFALGLKSFVNEAKLLARFDHPSLVKVYRFWEAHGTAYMAMPVYRGSTVKEIRLAMRTPPDETWLRALLVPLLGAIERLHAEGVYHRDIAPDNIQIEADGRPVLLDFGAARRVITDKSQALTAILKPAYAPIEQYAEAGSVRQGPWTDLYALGATLHFLLLGRPPSPATARAVHDDLQPLAAQSLPGCSTDFLHIVDWMLAPRPADRPQSVAALREVLDGHVAPPARRAMPLVPTADWERTQAPSTKTAPAPAVDDSTVIVPPRRTVPPPAAMPPAPASPAEVRSPAATPAAAPASPSAGRSRMFWPALLGVGALVVAAAVGLWPRPAPAPAATPITVAPSAASVAGLSPAPTPALPLSAISASMACGC
ncbi:MAG: serine/threonine-protein kinase, partial [Rubrivivax sp.]|nr:serine/threonine-protein kinase [Rubrivivax sp.]